MDFIRIGDKYINLKNVLWIEPFEPDGALLIFGNSSDTKLIDMRISVYIDAVEYSLLQKYMANRSMNIDRDM